MHFLFLFEVILSHTPTTILMQLLSTYWMQSTKKGKWSLQMAWITIPSEWRARVYKEPNKKFREWIKSELILIINVTL